MGSPLVIIDPAIVWPEDLGVREIVGDWPGEVVLLRPGLIPSDVPDRGWGHEAAGIVAPAGDGSAASPVRRFLTQKPLTFWIRLFLGAVFVAASVDKILHPAAFAQSIYNYQIFPDALINLTAIILPWLELLLGALLIGGWWLPGAAALVNLLLLAFYGALLFNVARGLDVHCGCFTTSTEGTPATTWYLIRDSIFLLLSCTLT